MDLGYVWASSKSYQLAFFDNISDHTLLLRFALTEASYLIVRLMHEYDAIKPADYEEMRKLKKGLGVTMWPGDGCKVRFHTA